MGETAAAATETTAAAATVRRGRRTTIRDGELHGGSPRSDGLCCATNGSSRGETMKNRKGIGTIGVDNVLRMDDSVGEPINFVMGFS